MTPWEFWIDVGGTFTDCLALTPDRLLLTRKVLSSGATQGRVAETLSPVRLTDPERIGDPEKFWIGYAFRLFDAQGRPCFATRVQDFDARTGSFTLAATLPLEMPDEAVYELKSEEEAPLLAIRYLLGLRLQDPLPPVSVRLGTTRGTNALLTRRGARTAFVTTRGFGDVLLIGNQDRPRLFDLHIEKPTPLFERVVEIEERLDVSGSVLVAPDAEQIRRQLHALKSDGIESLGICLLHGFAHPQHEQLVERIAREVGFQEISVSSRLSPLIKLVSRGDTTVADAYLNPILRNYIAKLQKPLQQGQLKLMTSAGGLVDSQHFVGKDSILSGPAGGVVGYARVAQQAGFPKSIGFDMGGTSTDVSRFDGTFEREFETKKAGVRIVAPMLAVETVAAGGGSVCRFDGIKLVVGPESAGASPGPACYGRGGPLTVTDMNFYSGKIPPGKFPFPLDRQIVEQKLNRLHEEILQANGPELTPQEIASGFLRVANANMVHAIRNVSVARGYDPRDYVLVTFGGAGGQHACALARALGMRKVLSHPLAGVLSAYGIGLADIRRIKERSILQPFTENSPEFLQSIFAELEAEARHEVLAQGIEAEQIRPAVRSLDLRYQGVETPVHVPSPTDGDYLRRFEELHQQLYGYVHQGRPLEVTTARVEVVGALPDPPVEQQPMVAREPTAKEWTQTWFENREHQTAVFTREELRPGDCIHGPAILCEPTSTLIVDPGFTATVLERGEIRLEDEAPVAHETLSTEADPILLEIFNNLFASIAEQMGTTLQRTSSSTNVKERLDFSCAIFSPRGELVVNAPHIPVHLGAMGETVKRILQDNPDLAAGDVFVTNDPFRGGSHLPDVTVVTPVHDVQSGALIFLTASRAHHAEIGGIVPGSMPPFSRNLAEEGVLIRNFKLVDQNVPRETFLKELLLSGPYPTRKVQDNLLDVAAQVAANRSGAAQLLHLVARYGLPVVHAYMGHIRDAAARKMRQALSRLEDGVYAFTDQLDDGSPIAVTISIRGDEANVDFTGTGPVMPGNLNANRAIVQAAVLYVFRCLINEEIPLNSGVLEPIRVILPECLLNPPEHDDPAQCAAVVGGNVETSQRMVDVMLGALKLAAASQGTMNNFTFGDATFGYYETICGGSGATPEANGADAVHTHMTNTRLTDAEVIERRYPVRIREFSIRKGSGGEGRHHGGDGIIRRVEFLKPLKVSLLTERRGEYAPFGLEGGEPGARGENSIVRAGQSEVEVLPGKVQLEVFLGDVLTIQTPGGGGYGKPSG